MKKTKIENVLFSLLLLNPILSLIFDNTAIYYHYITLPVIFAILLVLLVKKLTKNKLVLLMLIMCIFSSSFLFIASGASIGKLNNHFFNYLDFILICFYFYDKRNIKNFNAFFDKNINIIQIIPVIINLVELYMLLTGKGFVEKWTWGGTFFVGTSSMPHTLAYLMIVTIILCFVIYLKTKKKFFLLLTLLPFILIFKSGARVALIMALLLAIIFVDLMFSKRENSTISRMIKIGIICLCLIYLFKDYFMDSDLMNKIAKRESSGNNSAGRYILWEELLERYIHTPQNWLFGFGDDKVYYYSGLIPSVNVNIWAHSDYVQVLFGKGLIGIIGYLVAVFKYFGSLLRGKKGIYTYFIITIFLIASSLNGFYNYKDIMLFIPFFILLNNHLYKKDIK